MRPRRFALVAIAPSVLAHLRGEEAREVQAFLAAVAPVVDVAILGDAPELFAAWTVDAEGGGPLAALERTLRRAKHRPEQVLACGCEAADLALTDRCRLYLHLGEEHVLDRSVRRVVPLWGQHATGLLNALEHFASCDFRDVSIEHGDVVDFVDRSISFYEGPDAVARARAAHDALCADLMSGLEDEIAGIFAVGFPFYCPEPARDGRPARTPASILAYLREQRSYFASKLLAERTYRRWSGETFDRRRALRELGVRLERNAFDRYEYESAGASSPPVPRAATLGDLRASTAFDVREDPWPCVHCVALQAPDLHPRQRVTKDTNETCLRCRQTSLMLRNVTGCAVDLDAVIVVRGSPLEVSARIKQRIAETGRYLYDLDLRRMVADAEDGPLDLFVTSIPDLLAAFDRLATSEWLQAGFPAVALWSLTLPRHCFNLGEDFPVAFEPRTALDPVLARALEHTRHAFARVHATDKVVTTLREHSSARRQLLENPEIVAGIAARLDGWRSTPTPQPGAPDASNAASRP